MGKELTSEEMEKLHKTYTNINNFILKAHQEKVVTVEQGKALYMFVKELMGKDDPLEDAKEVIGE